MISELLLTVGAFKLADEPVVDALLVEQVSARENFDPITLLNAILANRAGSIGSSVPINIFWNFLNLSIYLEPDIISVAPQWTQGLGGLLARFDVGEGGDLLDSWEVLVVGSKIIILFFIILFPIHVVVFIF